MELSDKIDSLLHQFERKRSDQPQWPKAIPYVAGGGLLGAGLGAVATDHSDAKKRYEGLKSRQNPGHPPEYYDPRSHHGEGWKNPPKTKKPAKPFKAKGRFSGAERLARATHESKNSLLKIRRRNVGGGALGGAALAGAIAAIASRKRKERNNLNS